MHSSPFLVQLQRKNNDEEESEKKKKKEEAKSKLSRWESALTTRPHSRMKLGMAGFEPASVETHLIPNQ